MRYCLILAIVLGATPVQAGWLDFFSGPPCGARDWRCLLDTAVKVAAVTENGTDGTPRGNQQGEAIAVYPEAERQPLLERLLREAPKDDENYATRLEEFRPQLELERHLDAASLEKALRDKESPAAGTKLPDYMEAAFAALIARNEKDVILRLWLENKYYIYTEAHGSDTAIVAWLAKADPNRLASVLTDNWLPLGGWGSVSAAATDACRAGDLATGEALIEALDYQRASWKPERGNQAFDRSNTIAPVAECQGLASADKVLDEVLGRMEQEIAAAQARAENDDTRRLIVLAKNNEIVQNGVTPLVYAYLDAGREADALRTFKRLVPKTSTTTIAVTADGKPASEPVHALEDEEWQSAKTHWEWSRYRDLERPDWLGRAMDVWEKETGYDQVNDARDRMQRFIDAVASQKTPKTALVVRLRALGKAMSENPDMIGLIKEPTEIGLAALEHRLAGCVPSDEQLLAWQKGFAGAKYQSQRVDGYIQLAKLILQLERTDAGQRDAGYGACVIGAKPAAPSSGG